MKESTGTRWFTTFAHGLTVLIAALAICLPQAPAWANKTPFSKIVVFGDSVSDNGNLFKLTGGAAPAPPYWQGRFSDGPIWVEYLAQDLGMTGLLDDYAVGGATSGTQVNGAPSDWPHGTQSQIEQYLLSHPGDPDALYIIWTGHNDIFIPISETPMGDLDAARVAFVENMRNNIRMLWTAGAQHILVVNISDIGKGPGFLAMGSEVSAWASWLASSFNQGLAGALNELAAEGVATIAMDAFASSDTVFAHPAQFGFVNVTVDPFPESRAGYSNFGGHPSTQYHKVIAQSAERSLVDYFSPSRGQGQPPAQVNALNGLVRAGKP